MITVTLYTRDDCHLCEQALLDLKSLESEIPHELIIVDIDGNKDLEIAYGIEVPVVETGPYKLKAPFDRTELRITLGAAQDRAQQLSRQGRDAQLLGKLVRPLQHRGASHGQVV